MLKLKRGLCGGGVLSIVAVLLVWLGYKRWHSLTPSHVEPVSPILLSPGINQVHIITANYGGQMTRAIRNMLVQQCWAGGMLAGVNVSIAEPFSTKSQLVHTPQIWNELKSGQLHTASRFSDYYNLTHYNLQSMKLKSAPLISWDKFVKNAPRKAIAVSIPAHACNGVKIDEECIYSKRFRVFMDELSNMDFVIVRRVCLACSTVSGPFTFRKFIEIIFETITITDISILFDSWRNFVFTSSWIQIPKYCKSAEMPKSSDLLKPSHLIVSHSQRYIDKFVKKPFVGIMLRIERFLTLVVSGHTNGSIESCLNETLSIYDNIQDVSSYITVDIGKYGSGVMQNERAVSRFGKGSIESITKSVESVFRHLYKNTLALSDWENTFVIATGGITERGYIAMLQRDIASHSDCLILMGGGSFQQVAGYLYLDTIRKAKKNPCVHTVCVSNSFNKLFSS